ncbi:MAG: hypothetical protein J6Q48_06055 [Bacteroidaceae bacterium]|nr:hypothetical protein [Bacteroidaceae bacterium]
MSELELLKLRLENAIEGHKISLTCFYDKDTADMLELLEDCYSVICRIKPMDDDLK